MRRCPRCTHPAYVTDRFCLSCGQPLKRPRARWPWLLGCLIALSSAVGARAGLEKAPFAGAVLAGHASAAPATLAATPAPCHFVLGFKTLHDLIPARVGACRDDEQYHPATGVTIQHTSGGLLVWRRADNGVAFTDGAQTWLLGPHGLERRPNNRRFPWEANPGHMPLIAQSLGSALDTETRHP